MVGILFTSLLSLLTFSIFTGQCFKKANRYSILSSSVVATMTSLTTTKNNSKHIFMTFFMVILLLNILGNIPGMSTPTMFYWASVSMSMLLWISLILAIANTQPKSFIAHLLPFGSPMGLASILPMIEAFSHIIRPFTLMIRLSTNLSSGHIMLYMFSFFSLSSLTLTTIITAALVALMLLEIFVSMLQAYIFSSLISMYLNESQH